MHTAINEHDEYGRENALSEEEKLQDRILWVRATVPVLIESGPLLRFSSILVSARSSVVESSVPLLSVYHGRSVKPNLRAAP